MMSDGGTRDDGIDALDGPGDAADAADRLTRRMEAEAVEAALRGQDPVDGHLGRLDRPLEDLYDLAAAEDSDDASDDPFHAGGLEPDPWMAAEQAAMHVVDDDGRYLGGDDLDDDVLEADSDLDGGSDTDG